MAKPIIYHRYIKRLAFFGLLFFLLVNFSVFSFANDLDDAKRSIRVRDFDKAFSILSKLAESGNVEAQYQLSGFYRSGWSVEKSDRTAVVWLRKAADQGHVNAQYSLGTMYENGWGVPENWGKAERWYQSAAFHGHELALAKLVQLQALAEHQAKDPLLKRQRELFALIRQGNRSGVTRLLLSGVDINSRDSSGWTALMVAVESWDAEMVAVLLKGGADLEATGPEGQTALLLASSQGDPVIVDVLVRGGAKINHQDHEGNTALIRGGIATTSAGGESVVGIGRECWNQE